MGDVGMPSFEYLQNTNTNPAIRGIFAFSFYFPPFYFTYPESFSKNSLQENPYIKGIQMYLNAVSRPDSVFEGWKLVLYTDAASYAAIQSYGIFDKNSLIEFVVAKWDYYTVNGSLNGDVLRVLRFRAFFDFTKIPVFVRDADTLFAVLDPSTQKKYFEAEGEDLYQWERAYYEGAQKHPNTFIFGTSINYKRFWHVNKVEKRYIPMGAFAGLLSTIPEVPCFKEESLWNEMMDYIQKASIRKNNTFSNKNDKGRIGKDEQILSLIVLPKCIDHTFFFELDLGGLRRHVLRGRFYSNTNYPKIAFERGSNANIENIFRYVSRKLENKREANEHYSLRRREEVAKKNRAQKEVLDAAIDSVYNSLNSIDTKFMKYKGISSIPRVLYMIYTRLGTNEELEHLYKIYEKNERDFNKAKLQFRDDAEREGIERLAEQKKKLGELTEEYNRSVLNFLQKAIELKQNTPNIPGDLALIKEVEKGYWGSNIDSLKEVLSYITKGVLPQAKSSVPVASSLAGLFKKTGGRQTRSKRTKRIKRMTRKN